MERGEFAQKTQMDPHRRIRGDKPCPISQQGRERTHPRTKGGQIWGAIQAKRWQLTASFCGKVACSISSGIVRAPASTQMSRQLSTISWKAGGRASSQML